MKSFKMFWGYIIEILLTAALYVLLLIYCSFNVLEAFISQTRTYLIAIMAGLLAFSGAMFALYGKFVMAEFGDYLHDCHADGVFRRAFAWPIGVYFISTAVLIIGIQTTSAVAVHVITFILIYAVINFFTLTNNMKDIIRLNHIFRHQLNKAKKSDGKDAKNESSAEK